MDISQSDEHCGNETTTWDKIVGVFLSPYMRKFRKTVLFCMGILAPMYFFNGILLFFPWKMECVICFTNRIWKKRYTIPGQDVKKLCSFSLSPSQNTTLRPLVEETGLVCWRAGKPETAIACTDRMIYEKSCLASTQSLCNCRSMAMWTCERSVGPPSCLLNGKKLQIIAIWSCYKSECVFK